MIPKKIHYCWFGRGEKSKLFYKCYESWMKFFPDYEIIEWNEDNFDVYSNKYMREAYKEKKYSFVSDYARLEILYNEGGIYFDTDVEVLKKFESSILEHGYLSKETNNTINTGLGFAVSPKNEVIKWLKDSYENEFFIKNNEIDLTTCVERTTKILNENGIIINESLNRIGELNIFAPEYFCGFDIKNDCYFITENTITVHHYSGSWLNTKSKIIIKLKRGLSKVLGRTVYEKIRNQKKKVLGELNEK